MAKNTLKLELEDKETAEEIARMLELVDRPKPILEDIGEYVVGSTKQRFPKGIAPSGEPWKKNTPLTLERYLGKFGKIYGKDGRLNKRGAGLVAGKRPLIGETKRLGDEITYDADNAGVEIGSSLIYAGTQQFGAAQHSFTGGKTPWGDIPARPFLGLSTDDVSHVFGIVREHLAPAT